MQKLLNLLSTHKRDVKTQSRDLTVCKNITMKILIFFYQTQLQKYFHNFIYLEPFVSAKQKSLKGSVSKGLEHTRNLRQLPVIYCNVMLHVCIFHKNWSIISSEELVILSVTWNGNFLRQSWHPRNGGLWPRDMLVMAGNSVWLNVVIIGSPWLAKMLAGNHAAPCQAKWWHCVELDGYSSMSGGDTGYLEVWWKTL